MPDLPITDQPPDLPAVPGSIPFVHNVETAPAYWWLDILWIILVKGEDTGGRYSLMYEALPKGSGAPPHKHTWSDEHFYILEGEITFLVGDELALPAPSRTIPPKRATPPPAMTPELMRRYGMDNLPGPNPLALDQH